jgi:hypothetical protein
MRRWKILCSIFGLVISSTAIADRMTEFRNNRQKAVTVCNDYREKNRLPCFVSRQRCPRGFEVIQRFNSSPGTSFIACRDQRHERPPTIDRKSTVSDQKQQLLEQFNQLIKLAHDAQMGPPHHLPKSIQNKLSAFFFLIHLDKITIHQSQAISKGCFNDCQRVYCSTEQPLETWIQPNISAISINLLHQVAYAERCELLGGRERFVLSRLQPLPDEVLKNLEQGQPFDASRIHYANTIERHVTNRTESICRRVHCINH